MDRNRSAITLACIPSGDIVLKACAKRALVGARTRTELERRLRPVFPGVVVRPQHELAAVNGQRLWYVYRDGAYDPFGSSQAFEEEGVARAVFDDAGTFVDADDQAALIFQLRRDELIGASHRDFVSPLLYNWLDATVPHLGEIGVVESRWLVYLRDGTSKYLDFRLQDDAGAHRHGALLQEVPVDLRRGRESADGSGETANRAS